MYTYIESTSLSQVSHLMGLPPRERLGEQHLGELPVVDLAVLHDTHTTHTPHTHGK